MLGKKRLLLAAGTLATVGAVAALASGVTFGLFSSTQTSSGNTFTAGTLSIGTPVVQSCTVAHIVPGDNGTCTVTVTTAGSENADVAIDVAVAGTAATLPLVTPYGGGSPTQALGLFDNSANGLQISLTDGTPTTYNLSGLSAATSSTTDLLTADNVAPGTTEVYTLTWSMADNGGVDNNYQGASSTFTFDVHSVQAANQAADSTAAGQPDSTIIWS
jgi:predicted ribosomally synthesized peptide with SipW-like signal peptide